MKNRTDILDEAKEILTGDDEHRKYGSIYESTRRTAMAASVLSGVEISPEMVTAVYIAGKLCREGYNHKTDNLVDIAAYTQMLDEIKEKQDISTKGKGTKFLHE